MNSIKAEFRKSIYNASHDFLSIIIDGQPLDVLLDKCMPDRLINGLIPTLLFRMERDVENEIVWDRVLPGLKHKVNCPILMCPDDLDFSCTIITAEVEYTGLTYIWKNFAFDKTKDVYQNPEWIGRNKEFITGGLSFEFEMREYNDFVQNFQNQYLKDHEDWGEKYPQIKYTLPW